jgi:hypothetical protein
VHRGEPTAGERHLVVRPGQPDYVCPIAFVSLQIQYSSSKQLGIALGRTAL